MLSAARAISGAFCQWEVIRYTRLEAEVETGSLQARRRFEPQLL